MEETLFVLVDDNGREHAVPSLPAGAKPGDVYRYQDGALSFCVAETKARAARVHKKFKRIFHK